MREGWSLKKLHQLIVTSAAYRRSSASPVAPAGKLQEPEYRLLWRGWQNGTASPACGVCPVAALVFSDKQTFLSADDFRTRTQPAISHRRRPDHGG